MDLPLPLYYTFRIPFAVATPPPFPLPCATPGIADLERWGAYSCDTTCLPRLPHLALACNRLTRIFRFYGTAGYQTLLPVYAWVDVYGRRATTTITFRTLACPGLQDPTAALTIAVASPASELELTPTYPNTFCPQHLPLYTWLYRFATTPWTLNFFYL